MYPAFHWDCSASLFPLTRARGQVTYKFKMDIDYHLIK